jgi:MoaA/NifB/PqqE/SkfB family radical SAM enzyme
MFRFDQLRAAHLEITSNCQAACPMCARNINGEIVNPGLPIISWKFEDYRRILNEDVLKQMEFLRFSGNYGDPMLNDDLIDMIEYTSFVNPKINIRIHTNGGARKPEWWAQLAKVMPKVSDVYFAIDGLEDTHHLHRIGTKYETIIRNAKSFIEAGGNAVWVFLSFKHNEHQEQECEKIAKELGFARFVARKTLRFFNTKKMKVVDKQGNVTHYLEPSSSDQDMKYLDFEFSDRYNDYIDRSVINCPVLQNKEVYIDAWQKMFPCCYIGVGAKFPVKKLPNNDDRDSRFINMIREIDNQKLKFIERIEKNFGNDLRVKSLKDVLDGYEWQSIDWHKEYWGEEKLKVCARTCGENVPVSKPKEQYYKVSILKSVNEEYDSDTNGVEETRRSRKSSIDYKGN